MKISIFRLLSILLISFLSDCLFSLQPYLSTESMVIEGNNWKIYQSVNMSLKKINNKLVFKLNENIDESQPNLDLYLDFEAPLKNIPSYKVMYANYDQNRYQYVNGNYSAKFYVSDNYISLLPLPTSIFAPGNIPGSFTIEFWLYLYKNYDNQYVIKYIGNNLSDEKDKNIYGFSIFTKNSRLIYQFNNIFFPENKEPISIEIKESENLQLYKWEHHAVSFNNLDGKISTYKNGVEQEVKWVTANGKPLSPIFNPLIKNELSTPLIIGQNALFSLDNLKITKDAIDKFYLKKYKNTNSSILTDIYKFSNNISTLKKISFNFDMPDYSFIKFAYRISDHYFLPDDNQIKWVYVQNNIESFPAEFQSGRYIQFKMEAYPYEEMDKEITIQSIKADYTVDNNPYPPVIQNIVPLDEKVQISWTPSPEDDIAGYEIYYGSRTEDYISDDAAEGKSPIFVPATQIGRISTMNYTISGLVNERPYFLSIRSVDKNGHRSTYSKEVYVRPSTVYNDNKYSIGR